MKIMYLLHGRFPTEKAHGVQIAKLCEALGRQGHTVTLVAPRFAPVPDPFDFYQVERTFSLEYIPLASFMRSSRFGFMLEKLRFLRKASALCSRAHPDAIITREPLVLFFRPRAPVVLEMHDVPRHIGSYASFIHHARVIIAKTNRLRDDLVHAGIPATSIAVMSNAIDPREYERLAREDARQSLGIPSDARIALYAGSLQSWKGIGTIMRTAPLVPHVMFMIVGGKPEDIAHINSTAIPNVHFVGAVSHGEVPQYLASADMLLLPNERGNELSERYTSPLKLFEYQAAGKPVIASSLPSIREVLSEDEAYLFEAGDASGLAQVVKEILANPVEAANRAERARAHVLNNTWDAYALRLLALLAPSHT